MNAYQIIHRGPPTSFFSVIRTLAPLADDEVSQVIEMGGAYVGKRRCKDPHRLIRKGQSVSVYFIRPIRMQKVAFDRRWIVAREKNVLIAAKPTGMPTQGTRTTDINCFYELLKANCSGYLGLHHRLDWDTSGLLIFSRDKSINSDLAELFRLKMISKTYLAVCSGTWPKTADRMTIDAPIAPQRTDRGTIHRVSRSGKPATTEISRLGSHDHIHLIAARPITGRTHQIRVHLAHRQLPVFGDRRYGSSHPPPCRLHCASLKWPSRGKLEAGNYRLPPDPNWWHAVPADLFDVFNDWWKNQCPEQ